MAFTSSRPPRSGPAHAAPTAQRVEQPTVALRDPSDDPQLRRFLEASEPQAGDEEKPPRRWRPSPRLVRSSIRFGVIAVVIVLAVLVLRVWVVSPYYIPSESMEPTLHGCAGCTNDRVLVDKISYDLHSIHASDIVVFNRPKTAGPEITDKVLIKRVVALGGDEVAIKNGHVFVNNQQLREPYVKSTQQCPHQTTLPHGTTSRWLVPSHDVFVLGDNRCDSEDSRYFGPIADSSVIGRAFIIYWPLSHFGFLN
jgi:signal peptidase I